ncbi:UNVERIFIED_ORG: DUF2218 domain-containing protein (plasmid) [Roseateles sp. XES5]|uniref:DUF2218 domain-containing protein n=1 Tax=Shinella sp. G-2 TaxID=3133141 RepID=UPI001D02511B|nr:DUF2218 domain-containing protein [Roseateles sp. XES5]
MEATTRFETENSAKYLQQLCKHFAHKVDVTYGDTRGECRFSCGTSVLTVAGNGLDIHVAAADAEGLRETKAVIENHLLRFAFRETPPPFTWRAVT